MRHTAILGQSGVGKSNLLENLIVQDIEGGKGLCLLDPHGDLVRNVLNRYPMKRNEDLILIDFQDSDHIIPFNFLAWKTPKER